MKQNNGYEKNSDFYKLAYDPICVSEEMKFKLRRLHMNQTKKSYFHVLKMTVAAAAAICLLFTGLVNGSTAFAASVEKIPVVGKIAKLVLFRSYSEETQDYAISVSIPALIENNGVNSDLSDELNAEILELCEQYASDAKERALEYREAFLETGGTEEEWEAHNITISVDYEIKSESNDYLSFVIYGYESWLSSEAVAYYYNLNVHTMQYVTLEELLGEDYVDFVNAEIKQQIKNRQGNGNDVFFTQEEGGFESISEDQNYYINHAGNVVIVFEKYTIAPGFMGNVEFEIATS
ncbi:MAG: anti-sigma-V factor rsiV [Lachnospiraceae bacterium]|nr:anti-sigma-V factor rsiV [Lachnospiraceae bacterium]